MVNLVDEWEALEKYAGNTPGHYQLLENENKIEVRIWIGNCGIKAEFEANDPKLMRVLDFCWKHCTKICGNIPDSEFFNP